MDQVNLTRKLQALVQKYKYALIILVIGLVLMLIPGQEAEASDEPVEEAAVQETEDLESRLEELLRQINGAGEVRVLLTVESGEEVVYQTNFNSSESQQSEDTVIVDNSDRAESALVRVIQSAVYRGAVVACQGADSAAVRLAIVEAVSCATGLRSDQISVVKMN